MEDQTDVLRWWLALWRAPGIGARSFQRLLQFYPSPQAVFRECIRPNSEFKLSARSRAWLAQPDWRLVDMDLDWLAKSPEHHILCWSDSRYPPLLQEIADPPPVLFVCGDPAVLQQTQVSIVGSRNASITGQETARALARDLSDQGVVITSGMALGIDAASHEGALAGLSETIAVAGTGLDKIYPVRHKNLAERIISKGALISEFPIGTPPLAGNFPRRNRIISGLSQGVLVVEAAMRSGSLITARMALEQGRDVFAVPGSIHNPLAKGCNALIQEGAKLVEMAADIIDELGFVSHILPVLPVLDGQKETLSMDAGYGKLLACVGYEPTAVDTMVARSGLTAESVCSMLLILELHGLVENTAGGFYCQTGKRIEDERKHT